ncbi:MAG TPA: hypothetical protein VJB37_02460 [Patescibacteria group bacterium]|nr:hypothetical protein [Patescibacteria group bacterium]
MWKIKQNPKIPTFDHEYSQFSRLRWISLAVLIILSFAIGWTIFFLYQHIYTAIANINTATAMTSFVNAEVLDFKTHETILRNEEKKKSYQTQIINLERDPFNLLAPPPPPTP